MNAVAAVGQSQAVTVGEEGSPAVTASPPTIADQVDEVGKELRNRERYYPGRLKPETAERKLECLRAAHKTLLLIAKHAEGLRLLIKVLQRVERFGPAREDKFPIDDGEAEMLLQQPAVRNLLKAFPGCELADIRSISSEYCVDPEKTDSNEGGF